MLIGLSLLAFAIGVLAGRISVRHYRLDRIAWAQRRLQLKVLSLEQRRTTGKPEPHPHHLHRLTQPLAVQVRITRIADVKKPCPSFEGQGFNYLKHLPEGGCLSPGEIRPG